MALVLGGPAGPDGFGGAYDNTVQTDRAALWHALGGRQGVVKGFVHAGVAGQMALDFTPGAALVGERDASGVASIDRGYLVYAAETTRVLFGPASASARNDAVVAAFVDVESGPVGTGGLEVGPHLVVVPGVSGTSTPRTDTQINDFLGRGGWTRLLDVPVASGATEIALGGVVAHANTRNDTGWVPVTGVDPFAVTASIRRVGKVVYTRGVFSRASGFSASYTTAFVVPAEFRPAAATALAVGGPSSGTIIGVRAQLLTTGEFQVAMSGANSNNMNFGGVSWLVD